MSAGSFWTQPAGEVHITSAKGAENIAYIEIDAGPYLVLPAEEASDNGERPVNSHRSNLVWLDAANTSWIQPSKGQASAEIAFLWDSVEKRKIVGTALKLPSGFDGQILCSAAILRGVVIEGQAEYRNPQALKTKTLEPGSYFGSKGNGNHHLRNTSSGDCLVYIRTNGKYFVNSPTSPGQ